MAISAMTNSGPPVTEEALVALESKLAARLPVPYRRFLRKHNGGRPEPGYFGRFTLHTFYSVGSPGKMHDLLANQRRMRKWLPDGVIPIADDDFGNEICLAIKGKNRGKVYFWDHEGAPENIDPRIEFPWLDLGDDYEFKGDDWPGHPDLTLVADNFTKFLDSFHDFEPEDEPVPAKPTQDTKKPPARAGATGKQPAKAKSAKTKPAGK